MTASLTSTLLDRFPLRLALPQRSSRSGSGGGGGGEGGSRNTATGRASVAKSDPQNAVLSLCPAQCRLPEMDDLPGSCAIAHMETGDEPLVLHLSDAVAAARREQARLAEAIRAACGCEVGLTESLSRLEDRLTLGADILLALERQIERIDATTEAAAEAERRLSQRTEELSREIDRLEGGSIGGHRRAN